MFNATAQNEALFNSAFLTGVLYAGTHPAPAAEFYQQARAAHASNGRISGDLLGLSAQDTADLCAILDRVNAQSGGPQ